MHCEYQELEDSFVEMLEDGLDALSLLRGLIGTAWDYLDETDRIELARITRY